MNDLIEHSGVVVGAEGAGNGVVRVRITSHSACGSCKAREACGLAEATEKIIEVHTDRAADFAAGDRVMVGVRRNIGFVSVALAYVGALIVLLAVLFGAVAAGAGEGVAAVAAIVGVVLYYCLLWLMRRKIERTIQFTITKS